MGQFPDEPDRIHQQIRSLLRGFHFAGNIIYNLGAVFEETPHTFGRAWFPCRDVFADKATYQYSITVPRGWEATCSGIRDSVSAYASDSSRTFHYSVSHPISTYLSSVTIGNFRLHSKNINSPYGTYPLEVRFLSGDSNNIANTFAILDTVVPMPAPAIRSAVQPLMPITIIRKRFLSLKLFLIDTL